MGLSRKTRRNITRAGDNFFKGLVGAGDEIVRDVNRSMGARPLKKKRTKKTGKPRCRSCNRRR